MGKILSNLEIIENNNFDVIVIGGGHAGIEAALAAARKKHKTLMNFDGLLYMFGIPMMIITLLLLVINVM